MKIAANDVERIVMAAQAAAFTDSSAMVPDDLSLEDRVKAFRRAAELQNTSLRWCRVRGAKSGVYRDVFATHTKRTGKGGEYTSCLIPFTPMELLRARVSRMLSARMYRKVHKKRKDGTTPETPWPVKWHTQWVRSDRLESASR